MTADTDITDRPYGSAKKAASVQAPTQAEVDAWAYRIVNFRRDAHTVPLGVIRALAANRLDALDGNIVTSFAASAAEGEPARTGNKG